MTQHQQLLRLMLSLYDRKLHERWRQDMRRDPRGQGIRRIARAQAKVNSASNRRAKQAKLSRRRNRRHK